MRGLLLPAGDVGHHRRRAQGLASVAVNQQYESDWGGLFAGLISMLPILIVYAVFQRQVQAA
ncbi:MAG: hypothetical protein ACR2F6_08815 [Mycobacteriales bacterium]